MTAEREALELECQVRLIDLAAKHNPNDMPIDLYVDGFWEGVRAATKPRSVEVLRGLLAMRRARAAGLIK